MAADCFLKKIKSSRYTTIHSILLPACVTPRKNRSARESWGCRKECLNLLVEETEVTEAVHKNIRRKK